jgi:hypothetical protein
LRSGILLNDEDVTVNQDIKSMLSSLLSEALEVTFDNLNMASTILSCAEEAAEDLNPEICQRLALVHVGLAMAMQALEEDALHRLIAQVD